MTYNDLHWDTLNRTHSQLQERLIQPLDKAINYVELSQDIEQAQHAQNLNDAHRQLSMMMNLVQAWESLIIWRTENRVDSLKVVSAGEFPEWLLEYLSQRAIIKLEHTQSIKVNAATFYEGVVLLVDIAGKVGELSHIMFNDATAPREGVWLRIVFMPKTSQAYQSKMAILEQSPSQNMESSDLSFQFSTANDLFELNGTRFSLQNNTRTGHQAFAVLLPSVATTETNTIPSETPDVQASIESSAEVVEDATVVTPDSVIPAPTSNTVVTVEASESTPDAETAIHTPEIQASVASIESPSPKPTIEIVEPAIENGLDTIPVQVVGVNNTPILPTAPLVTKEELGIGEQKPPEKVISLADQIRAAIAKLSTQEFSESSRNLANKAGISHEIKENKQDSGASREPNSPSSSNLA